jgi:hypothetical protein
MRASQPKNSSIVSAPLTRSFTLKPAAVEIGTVIEYIAAEDQAITNVNLGSVSHDTIIQMVSRRLTSVNTKVPSVFSMETSSMDPRDH